MCTFDHSALKHFDDPPEAWTNQIECTFVCLIQIIILLGGINFFHSVWTKDHVIHMGNLLALALLRMLFASVSWSLLKASSKSFSSPLWQYGRHWCLSTNTCTSATIIYDPITHLIANPMQKSKHETQLFQVICFGGWLWQPWCITLLHQVIQFGVSADSHTGQDIFNLQHNSCCSNALQPPRWPLFTMMTSMASYHPAADNNTQSQHILSWEDPSWPFGQWGFEANHAYWHQPP